MKPVICNCRAANDNNSHCRVPLATIYEPQRHGMVVGEVLAAYCCHSRLRWLMRQYDGTFLIVNKQRNVNLSNYERGRAVCIEPSDFDGAAIAVCLDTGAMR